MSTGYIDRDLIKKFPNKYKLTPKKIKKLKILDWDRLKQETWQNNAMLTGNWYCHLEGCQSFGQRFNDEDEFWIGFREDDNKIDCNFTSYGGMCSYKFDKFYDILDIENRFDMQVQVNTISWLNRMIDEGILGV
jgi:hypothetical protein